MTIHRVQEDRFLSMRLLSLYLSYGSVKCHGEMQVQSVKEDLEKQIEEEYCYYKEGIATWWFMGSIWQAL